LKVKGGISHLNPMGSNKNFSPLGTSSLGDEENDISNSGALNFVGVPRNGGPGDLFYFVRK
jgi:hypothetical protein